MLADGGKIVLKLDHRLRTGRQIDRPGDGEIAVDVELDPLPRQILRTEIADSNADFRRAVDEGDRIGEPHRGHGHVIGVRIANVDEDNLRPISNLLQQVVQLGTSPRTAPATTLPGRALQIADEYDLLFL